MIDNVFEYSDYKTYLRDVLKDRPGGGRGERTKLAAIARCNTTYISQVLNGRAHFSLEHAERISRSLNHSKNEQRFFLLMIEYGRAGTQELRAFFLEQMQQVREQRQVLKSRLEFKESLSLEDQTTYYSAWYYTAVHLLITMPEFQTAKELGRYLGLPISRVQEILDALVRFGLAVQEGPRFRTGRVSIHLGTDSPMLAKHHINWRMQAIQDLDRGRKSNHMHYSSVVTVAESDVSKVNAVLIDAIERIRAVVAESKEDRLYCYAIDLFEVGGN